MAPGRRIFFKFMKIIRLPQLIDPHVHFRTPGLEHKEDWETGSRAAIAGGITTVLDMPNVVPPTTIERLLEEKIALIGKKASINYGLHFGATIDNFKEIPNVLGRIASVKVYMNFTTGNLLVDDEEALKKIFSVAPLVSAHAEDEMIEKAIWLTKRSGNTLYICHVYSKEAIDLIKKHKDKLPIYVEVAPHHLFLNREEHNGPFYVMRPPLRGKLDNEALWQAIDEGVVDTIGTDHAPHLIEEKKGETVPFGIPGIETVLPLMLNAVNEGKLSIERLIDLMSVNPAKIFNIPVSEETYTEVDMDIEREVKNEDLKTKCGWSPFAGWRLRGWPVKVVINGEVVMENNKIILNNKGKNIYG